MAIEQKPQIKDFYQRHNRTSAAIVVVFQFVSAAVLAGAMLVSGILTHQEPIFWALICLALAVGISVNIIALGVIIEPMRAITAALSYVAGEKSSSRPPNSNAKRYDKDGTKPMLDLIYKLTYENDTDQVHAANATSGTPPSKRHCPIPMRA